MRAHHHRPCMRPTHLASLRPARFASCLPTSPPACVLPTSPPCCAVEELKALLLNMHHLLNTFRPHHAREEMISRLQAMADAKQQLLDDLAVACAAAHWDDGVPDPEADLLPPVDPSSSKAPAAPAPSLSQQWTEPQRAATLSHLLAKLDAVDGGE